MASMMPAMSLQAKLVSVFYLSVAVTTAGVLHAAENTPATETSSTITWILGALCLLLLSACIFVFLKCKEAEKEVASLIESEERHKLAMEGNSDGLWDFDLVTNEVYFSDGYRKMLGYSNDEFPNNIELFNLHVHPDDKDTAWACIADHIASKIPVDIDFRMRNKQGNYRIVHVLARAIWNNEGVATRMVGSIRDITERVELETQLRQSQKMESIGQLTGGIAHDFNNVLSGIIGAADILLHKKHDPEDRELLELISNTAMRAADLTSRLLVYSRASEVNAKHLHMHQCINEALDILKNTIDKRISIVEFLEAEKDDVKGDISLLVNVIVNISLNARDAIDQTGTITIRTDNVTLDKEFFQNTQFNLEPGNFIHISIADTGNGISDELLERIFEPFFTTKQIGEGTGLGLSGAFGTMRDHQGAITVESTPDSGSCFHLYLPLAEADTSVHHDTSSVSHTIANGKILIVDDEPIILQTTQRLLQIHQHHIFTARDGMEALNVLETEPHIDVVLLDMIMPSMTGEECFDKMQELYPHLPIIIISGYTNEASIERLKARGLYGFLKKPFNMDALLVLINKALHKKSVS